MSAVELIRVRSVVQVHPGPPIFSISCESSQNQDSHLGARFGSRSPEKRSFHSASRYRLTLLSLTATRFREKHWLMLKANGNAGPDYADEFTVAGGSADLRKSRS